MFISYLMDCLVCGYCFLEIEENEEAASLEFSSEQIVHYHLMWYFLRIFFSDIAIMNIAENFS